MFNKKILNSAIISSGHLMNIPKIIRVAGRRQLSASRGAYISKWLG